MDDPPPNQWVVRSIAPEGRVEYKTIELDSLGNFETFKVDCKPKIGEHLNFVLAGSGLFDEAAYLRAKSDASTRVVLATKWIPKAPKKLAKQPKAAEPAPIAGAAAGDTSDAMPVDAPTEPVAAMQGVASAPEEKPDAMAVDVSPSGASAAPSGSLPELSFKQKELWNSFKTYRDDATKSPLLWSACVYRLVQLVAFSITQGKMTVKGTYVIPLPEKLDASIFKSLVEIDTGSLTASVIGTLERIAEFIQQFTIVEDGGLLTYASDSTKQYLVPNPEHYENKFAWVEWKGNELPQKKFYFVESNDDYKWAADSLSNVLGANAPQQPPPATEGGDDDGGSAADGSASDKEGNPPADDEDEDEDGAPAGAAGAASAPKRPAKSPLTAEAAFGEIVRFAVATAVCNFEGVTEEHMQRMINDAPGEDMKQWRDFVRESGERRRNVVREVPANFDRVPRVFFDADTDKPTRDDICAFAKTLNNKTNKLAVAYPLWAYFPMEAPSFVKIDDLLALLKIVSDQCPIASVLDTKKIVEEEYKEKTPGNNLSTAYEAKLDTSTKTMPQVNYIGYTNGERVAVLPVKGVFYVFTPKSTKGTRAAFLQIKTTLQDIFGRYKALKNNDQYKAKTHKPATAAKRLALYRGLLPGMVVLPVAEKVASTLVAPALEPKPAKKRSSKAKPDSPAPKSPETIVDNSDDDSPAPAAASSAGAASRPPPPAARPAMPPKAPVAAVVPTPAAPPTPVVSAPSVQYVQPPAQTVFTQHQLDNRPRFGAPVGSAEQPAGTINWTDIGQATRRLIFSYLLSALKHVVHVKKQNPLIQICLPVACSVDPTTRTVSSENFDYAVYAAEDLLDAHSERDIQRREFFLDVLAQCVNRGEAGATLEYAVDDKSKTITLPSLVQFMFPVQNYSTSATVSYAEFVRILEMDAVNTVTTATPEEIARFRDLGARRATHTFQLFAMTENHHVGAIMKLYRSTVEPDEKRQRTMANGFHRYCSARTGRRPAGLIGAPRRALPAVPAPAPNKTPSLHPKNGHRTVLPASDQHAHILEALPQLLANAAPLLVDRGEQAYLMPSSEFLNASDAQRLEAAVKHAGRKANAIIAKAFNDLGVVTYDRHNALHGSVVVHGAVLHHTHSALSAATLPLGHKSHGNLRVILVRPASVASHDAAQAATPLTAYLRRALMGMVEALEKA